MIDLKKRAAAALADERVRAQHDRDRREADRRVKANARRAEAALVLTRRGVPLSTEDLDAVHANGLTHYHAKVDGVELRAWHGFMHGGAHVMTWQTEAYNGKHWLLFLDLAGLGYVLEDGE